MAGEFFSGLAEGFFGSRMKQEEEQRKQDAQQRQEYIGVLSGLLDKVDPNSQGLLLQQMGDLMGLKGKQRGMWDMLTGKTQRDFEQDLTAKFQQIMGSIKSPQDYARLQQQAAIEDATKPQDLKTALQDMALGNTTPESAQQREQFRRDLTARQTAERANAQAQLPKAIALRDPRAERMQQFEQEKGLMHQQRMAQEQERAAYRKEEIRLRQEVKEEAEREKRFNVVAQNARMMAIRRLMTADPTLNPENIGTNQILQEEWDSAIQAMQGADSADTELKKARADFYKTQAGALSGGMYGINPTTGKIVPKDTPGAITSKADLGILGAAQRTKSQQIQQGFLSLANARWNEAQKRDYAKLTGDLSQIEGEFGDLKSQIVNTLKGKGVAFTESPDGGLLIDGRPVAPSDIARFGGFASKSEQDLVSKFNKARTNRVGLYKQFATQYPEQVKNLNSKKK